MRVLLANIQDIRTTQPARLHELLIDVHEHGGTPSTNVIDLVIIDAQGMQPAMTVEALEWLIQLKQTHTVGSVAMLWPNPPVDMVVRAIRAGVNDLLKGPLSALRLYRLLRKHTKTKAARFAARAIIASGKIMESTGFTAEQANLSSLLNFERRLHQREEHLFAETKRLEDLREILHCRENDLRLSARRLDDEFARLQTDSDLHAQPASAGGRSPDAVAAMEKRLRELEAELQLRNDEVEQRASEVAARERLLQEFEAMLVNQVVAPSSDRSTRLVGARTAPRSPLLG